jgi:chromosome segregation ATPase
MSTLSSDRWLPATAIVLGLGIAGSMATLVYQHGQLANAQVEVAGLRREVSVVRQDIGTAESRLREKVDTLNGEMAATRKQTEQTKQSVDRARVNVRKQAEALVSKVAVNQEAQRKQLAAELDSIKYTADQASVRLTDIGSEVGEVKDSGGVRPFRTRQDHRRDAPRQRRHGRDERPCRDQLEGD